MQVNIVLKHSARNELTAKFYKLRSCRNATVECSERKKSVYQAKVHTEGEERVLTRARLNRSTKIMFHSLEKKTIEL